MMIDTHTHLYSAQFGEEEADVVQRAREAGVSRVYLPAIDQESHQAMIDFEARYPDWACAMMGLHPCSVQANYQEELAIVESWLKQRRFAAVGEIGLDHYWDKTFVREQEEAFRIQIEWALTYQYPIVIHTRNAMQETINIVKEYAPRGLRGIFHCFSGSIESAREIIKAGFFLGIGGVVTYPKAGLSDVLTQVDPSHLVLETDAPYLTPVPFRGKRNETSYLVYVRQQLMKIYGKTADEIDAITTANAENIFGAYRP